MYRYITTGNTLVFASDCTCRKKHERESYQKEGRICTGTHGNPLTPPPRNPYGGQRVIQLAVLIVVLVLIKKGGGVDSLDMGYIHAAITRSRNIATAARGGSFLLGRHE